MAMRYMLKCGIDNGPSSTILCEFEYVVLYYRYCTVLYFTTVSWTLAFHADDGFVVFHASHFKEASKTCKALNVESTLFLTSASTGL